MLEALRSAVEELELPPDGDAITTALSLLDRLTAKVSVAIAEWDKAKQWELDAATSGAAWLRHRAGMTASLASTTVKTAKLVSRLPVTASAWLSGDLSTGQVRAITANVDDRTVETFAEQESALLPYLVPLTVPETATAMQHWRARVEVDRMEDLPERALHLSRTLGGRFELSGSLDALSGEVVSTALRVASVDDVAVLPATRRADALVDVCRFYLDHRHDRTGGRNRPHLNVVVDYDDLIARRGGETVEGTLLDG
ncbi:MAG TPA: DUF222 domain-containing protein, partial [Acidimicrobiales bacterium]